MWFKKQKDCTLCSPSESILSLLQFNLLDPKWMCSGLAVSWVLSVIWMCVYCLDFATKRCPLLTPDLGLPFGHVINSRSPQLKEPLFPGLLAVFFEVQHCFEIRHNDGSPAEVLLQAQKGWKGLLRGAPTEKTYFSHGLCAGVKKKTFLPVLIFACLCLLCLWELSCLSSIDKSSAGIKYKVH